MLATLFYHRSRISNSSLPSLPLSTLFFLGALLSKETAMLFPAILLCYEFFYARIRPAELPSFAKRLAPFLVVLTGYLVARIQALGGFAPFPSLDRPQLPFAKLLLAVPPIFARYIGKLIVPIELQYFYSFPLTTTFTAWAAVGIVSSLLLVAAAFYFRKSQPLLAFALCWFALTLAPALSINSLATNFFTERYLYIPSLGFCILATSAALTAFSALRAASWRFILGAAIAALFIFYVVQTERRLPIFRDNFSLLSDTVRYSPNSYQIQSQLAATYYDRGDLDHALEHALIALQLNPDYEIGQMNAAWYFTDKKNYDAAITHLLAAIRLYPDYPPPWINLARVYLLQHNWPLARETYDHLIEIDPEEAPVFRKFAAFATANEKPQLAAAPGHSVAEQFPLDFHALVRLGDAASQARQWQRAAHAFERASALQPENSAVLDKWGISLQASGDAARAAEVLQRAVQLQPDSLYIRQAFAGALAGANRIADSSTQLHKILQMNPTWEHTDQVHLALAVNAEKANDRSTAIQEYQRALALNPSLDFATKRLAALK
jgi:tetratricopeptide (TPR) repeat protein